MIGKSDLLGHIKQFAAVLKLQIILGLLILFTYPTPSLSDDLPQLEAHKIAGYQITPERLTTGMYVHVVYSNTSQQIENMSGYVKSVDNKKIIVRKSPLYSRTIHYQYIKYIIVGFSRESVEKKVRATGIGSTKRKISIQHFLAGPAIGAGIGAVAGFLDAVYSDALTNSFAESPENKLSSSESRENQIQGILWGGLFGGMMIGIPLGLLLSSNSMDWQPDNLSSRISVKPNHLSSIQLIWTLGK